MKKIKLSKTQEERIKIFFRFLKNNNAYSEFVKIVNNFHKCHKIDFTYLERFKYYNTQLISMLTESGVLSGYATSQLTSYSEDYWCELDNKWLIFIYENKLYGKPHYCSKRVLLNSIADSIEMFAYNEKTIEKAKQICIKEGIIF